jgi:glycosyltransferase involved in cell wall biosynthesis
LFGEWAPGRFALFKFKSQTMASNRHREWRSGGMPLPSSKPLLSICIPTYNRATLLAQTLMHLRSVFSGNDVEIVVSDNFSPDRTQAVFAEFAPLFKHFKAIVQTENRGSLPNLAATIALASGEFTYTLSDDDEVCIDGLAAAISIMKSDERIVAVYGAYQEVSRDACSLSPPLRLVDQREDFIQGEKLRLFNRFSLLWYPVCRTSVLQRFCIYDERSFNHWELAGSFLEHGAIAVIPDVLYKHFDTQPRMEYELTKPWYHDLNRTQYESFVGRIGPTNFQQLSTFINARVVPAYTHAVGFATLKGEFLTARQFILRARSYAQFPEADIALWERQSLVGMVAERLLAHVRLATTVRAVLFEDHPKLSVLREQFRSIAPEFQVGELSQRDWEASGLNYGCYLVTFEYGATGWEEAPALGSSRCRAVVDIVETCRITDQVLSL